MTEKEKQEIVECIKALSRIDGATMAVGVLTNREAFTTNIEIIMNYLEDRLRDKELAR